MKTEEPKKLNTLPRNFVVVDCETSGLDPSRHSLLSIGAETADGATFYAECRPWSGAICDPAALAVNGQDWEEAQSRSQSPAELVCAFRDWLGVQAGRIKLPPETRWIMGGKNPQFDHQFLIRSLLEIWVDMGKCARHLNISRRCVDLHSLAYGWAMERGIDFGARDFSTDTIYAHLGFAKEATPHHALTGAKLEMAVFRKLLAGATRPEDLWHDASQVKPDVDMLVITHAPDSDWQEWPGYWTGEEWQENSGGPIAGVTHWREMPVGPNA
jgi:hypothetical protein